MTDFNSKIRARIETFISDLEDIISQAKLEAINEALRGALGGSSRRSSESAGESAVETAAPRASRGRRKGEKRSRDAIRQLGDRLLAHLSVQGGGRIEELSKALSIPTRDLTLPLKQLIRTGKVRKEGQRRATRYFAGKAKGRAKKGS